MSTNLGHLNNALEMSGSKRKVREEDITRVLTSRKRRLREFYRASQFVHHDLDFPAVSIDLDFDEHERSFIQENNILRGRLFDENTIISNLRGPLLPKVDVLIDEDLSRSVRSPAPRVTSPTPSSRSVVSSGVQTVAEHAAADNLPPTALNEHSLNRLSPPRSVAAGIDSSKPLQISSTPIENQLPLRDPNDTTSQPRAPSKSPARPQVPSISTSSSQRRSPSPSAQLRQDISGEDDDDDGDTQASITPAFIPSTATSPDVGYANLPLQIGRNALHDTPPPTRSTEPNSLPGEADVAPSPNHVADTMDIDDGKDSAIGMVETPVEAAPSAAEITNEIIKRKTAPVFADSIGDDSMRHASPAVDALIEAPGSSTLPLAVEAITAVQSVATPTTEQVTRAASGIPSTSRSTDTNNSHSQVTPSISTNQARAAPSSQMEISPTTIVPSEPEAASLPENSRMTTRVSSGALRHKSVSEIIGGTQISAPKPQSTGQSTPSGTATPGTRSSSRTRKDRPRTNMTRVIYADSQRNASHDQPDSKRKHGFGRTDGESLESVRNSDSVWDYFDYVCATREVFGQTLLQMISKTTKSVSSQDYRIAFEEDANLNYLKRVRELMSENKWSARQMCRAEEPIRQATHWDYVIQEAKWVGEDVKYGLLYRKALAKVVAECVMEWHNSDEEQRLALRAFWPRLRPASPPPAETEPDAGVVQFNDSLLESNVDEDTTMSGTEKSVPIKLANFSNEPDGAPTPVSNATPTATDQAEPIAIVTIGLEEFDFEDSSFPHSEHPDAVFSYGEEDLYLWTNKALAEDVYDKLPTYTFPMPIEDPDAEWRTPLVPVNESMFAPPPKPKRPLGKRSRYDYQSADSYVDEFELGDHTEPLPPRNRNVGLFNPEYAPILKRIHAAHPFRPPQLSDMPVLGFFEHRFPSKWTSADDEKLKLLQKEYMQNWALISSEMSPKSLFSSSSDRRTQWECFERWLRLEGLSTEFTKSPYYKQVSQRLEWANRPNARRGSSQPTSVDRKRQTRFLNVIEMMKKAAKKKESAQAKQAQTAQAAAMRRPPDNQQRNNIPSPAEFSKSKHDLEKKLQFQQQQQLSLLNQQRLRLNPQAQVSAVVAAQVQGRAPVPSVPANPIVPSNPVVPGVPAIRNVPANVVNGVAVPNANMTSLASSQANGVAAMNPNLRAAQSAGLIPANGALGIEAATAAMHAKSIQVMQQQRNAQLAQLQRAGAANNAANLQGGIPHNVAESIRLQQQQAHLLRAASGQGLNGISAAQNAIRLSSSPPQVQAQAQQQQLTQIYATLAAQNPTASKQDLDALLQQHYLYRQNLVRQMTHQGGNASVPNMVPNPQAQAELIRNQQLQQAARSSSTGPVATAMLNGLGRSGTPQRPGSSQAQQQSPRQANVQMNAP